MAGNFVKLKKLQYGTHRQHVGKMTANLAVLRSCRLIFRQFFKEFLNKMCFYVMPAFSMRHYDLSQRLANFYFPTFICNRNLSGSTAVTLCVSETYFVRRKTTAMLRPSACSISVQCDISSCKVFLRREGLQNSVRHQADTRYKAWLPG